MQILNQVYSQTLFYPQRKTNQNQVIGFPCCHAVVYAFATHIMCLACRLVALGSSLHLFSHTDLKTVML